MLYLRIRLTRLTKTKGLLIRARFSNYIIRLTNVTNRRRYNERITIDKVLTNKIRHGERLVKSRRALTVHQGTPRTNRRNPFKRLTTRQLNLRRISHSLADNSTINHLLSSRARFTRVFQNKPPLTSIRSQRRSLQREDPTIRMSRTEPFSAGTVSKVQRLSNRTFTHRVPRTSLHHTRYHGYKLTGRVKTCSRASTFLPCHVTK